MKVPFFKPVLGDDEITEVLDTLKSGWLTTGPKTKQFENKFAEYVNAARGVALNSCTAALHLALEAIGIQPDELVVVPTMTFAATAEVVRYFDAKPVFVDCDETMNLDPSALETTLQALKDNQPVAGMKPPFGKIRAIIPVHYGGYSCQMDKIMEVANRFEIDVIEDAAHTVDAWFRKDEQEPWVHTGRFGRVGCFSFYANKCITTGEGGMAVTDEEELADRMTVMSLHGMNKDSWKRFSDSGSWYYEIVAPGYKYNLTDIAACIGLHQLKRASEYREARTSVANRFTEAFEGLEEIDLAPVDAKTRIHAWHLYAVRLKLEKLKLSRAEFIDELTRLGIICSVHWMPLHLHPYYRKIYSLSEGLFPTAEDLWPRLVSLPIYPAMEDEQVEYVVSKVTELCHTHSK